MRRAHVVVDLGFGDAGKGGITDFLVRSTGARLVVRFNGGAQAGHRVVAPGGRSHVFSQVGAGAFAGARTLLGPDFALHPGGFAVEAAALAEKGVDAWATVDVDARARVVSPFQQAAGRLRELARAEKHGTCGVGIGECVADAGRDDAIAAADLQGSDLRRRLRSQQERKRAETRDLDDPRALPERRLLSDPAAVDRIAELWRRLPLRIASPEQVRSTLSSAGDVVLEGAQGALLDQEWGFHPHTTWSDCTAAGALALLDGLGFAVTRVGVTRSYSTRHGAGPFPTEDGVSRPDPENGDAGWQGRFRTGPLDLVLLRYAARVSPVDVLAVTWLDRPPGVVCAAYEGGVRELEPGERGDLAHRERLGRWLLGAKPVLEPCEDLVRRVEAETGLSVRIESRGASALAKTAHT